MTPSMNAHNEQPDPASPVVKQNLTTQPAAAQLGDRLDRAYAERNALAIAFAKAALAAGWRAGRGYDDDQSKDWAPQWRHVVYVDLPDGRQVSWHMAPAEVELLDRLPQYAGEWNGEFTARDPSWCRFDAPAAAQEAVAWPNECSRTVPEALRFLANHERPSGGEDRFNSLHLIQLASEIERMASKPLYAAPVASASEINIERFRQAVACWRASLPPYSEGRAEADRLFALINGQTDASTKGDVHPDDLAVDAFAAAMKAKLADARAKGRGGWQGDEPRMQQRLSDMLRAHVEKGDPRDVANFCMFLHQRGEGISAPAPIPRPMDTAPRDGTVVRLLVQFEEHLIEDTDEPAWTIGACNDDLVPDDERTGWQVAGWCWDHDHFTEGKGTPVGWLPMLDSPKGDTNTEVRA